MKRFVSALMSLIMLISVFAAFPMTVANAASMDDATFFAKFDYASNPGLSDVKACVDAGDYDAAKAELLQYFKDRKATSSIQGFGITDADEFYGMAVLPMRNILTGPYEFDMWQAEFTVTSSSYKDYEIDVTERIADELNNGAVSFMLFAGDKQQYPVYVKSKEAGNNIAPRLVVTYDINGKTSTATITADNDTYISSQNTSTTYGSATELNIKEDGTGSSSTGTNTRRAYLNFPLDAVANSTIVSANLVLNAAYAADCTTGDKDVLVINVGDTMWSENSLTWAGTRGSIYSYQNASVPTWNASAPNADSEYHNVTSRFWFAKPMAYEYLSYLEDPAEYNRTHPYSDVYPGEDFGPKLVELMDAFASQRAYGYTRTLETGERLNRWVDIVDAFLETDVFDTRLDEFCNIISFMWGDCNYLAGLDIANGSYWWSNWRIVANAGFFKAVEYFPEFALHDTWREKVEYNVEYTFDLLYNSDYSFTEAGPSYSTWCVKLFGDCLRAADMSGNPMSAVFREKVKYAARNSLESYYPNGYDTNIGDSNYKNQMPWFEMLNDVFGQSDPVINSYVTGQDEGAEYLTRYYHNSNSAYMRNSWDSDEAVYINFTNNPLDGHYHPDSNQVIMYAYGSPLLVDSGRYSYSSTNSIYDTLRTAASHNTIEAVGVNMGAHSAATSSNALLYANANDTFDFASSEQHGYSNTSHVRNVFFARSGFGIVTDYVTGSQSRTYRQNWHFMPSSNAAFSGNTAKTNFYNAPDITVAAASADSVSIRSGYHSADYGLVAESEYASIQKAGATVKFDTLLYPERADEEITATATDLAANDTSKAAIKITVDGNDAYYYVRNTADADGTFGSYSTDAKMAYVSDTEYMIADGKAISGKIESSATIISMGVELSGGTVVINGEKLIANSDSASAIKIYAPNATEVIFNGEEISFTKSGNYIYAVASAIGESVTGAVAKVYPTKDGFYATSSGNEGNTTHPTLLQAAIGWQNRNAYFGFDLSDFKDKEITSAVLKMKMQENASAGNLHFYYLDYGTWTRSTLSTLVLDSSKMPSHTANKGTYTGYSYRWSGNVSGITAESWASLNSNLPDYIAANDNYKFTWAMLSEAGSARFYGLPAVEANRPYLEITYNYQTSSEGFPVVTIKKYLDGKLASTETDSSELGSIYLYEAEDTITEGGVTYYINTNESRISTVVQKSDNVIEVYYESGKDITVSFTDAFGNTLSDSVTVTAAANLATYTYSAPATIFTESGIYELDASASTLSCPVRDNAKLTAVYNKAYNILSENLISGFDMLTNAKDGGALNWSVVDKSALDSSLTGQYIHLTGASEGGSAAKTMRTFIPIEGGKTYYVSNTIYNNTGDTTVNEDTAGMSAIIAAGNPVYGSFAGLTLYSDIDNGGVTSWHAGNSDVTIVGTASARNDITTVPGENKVEYIVNTPAEAKTIMLSYGAWGNEELYYGDFAVYQISPVRKVNVTFDGKQIETEGVINLGIQTEAGYTLPENVIGYYVTSGADTKFVNAGELIVNDGDIITTTLINVEMVTGAQVRYGGGLDSEGKVSQGNGLRFIARVDRSSVGEEITGYGMKITAAGSSESVEIPADKWQDGDSQTIFTAALTDLAESNYNRSFTAVPYVNVKYSDGSSAKIYATEGITRSIYQVAVGLLKNSSNTVDGNDGNYDTSDYGLYDVLNAYVNMVGIRLTMTSDGNVTARTNGSGSYSGDVFFNVTTQKKSDNVYTVTVTPITENFNHSVTLMDYWSEFIRINNNHSVVINNISNSVTNPDGSVTFDFTLPSSN